MAAGVTLGAVGALATLVAAAVVAALSVLAIGNAGRLFALTVAITLGAFLALAALAATAVVAALTVGALRLTLDLLALPIRVAALTLGAVPIIVTPTIAIWLGAPGGDIRSRLAIAHGLADQSGVGALSNRPVGALGPGDALVGVAAVEHLGHGPHAAARHRAGAL